MISGLRAEQNDTNTSIPRRINVLAILPDTRLPDNSRLYDALAQHVSLDVVHMNRSQRRDLAAHLGELDLSKYDRVILELRFKHAMPQLSYLRTLPNLVLIEEDTWQNYVSFGTNQGKFTSYYEALRPRRIVTSGCAVAQSLRAQGHDAVFLGKGFDGTQLYNTGSPRDIEAAFVGRHEHPNYRPRKRLLIELEVRCNLPLLRTRGIDDYRNLLNRIRVFVSADIHFGEYMIKNFEAMACGCLLLAYRQGVDDRRLGLRSGENCLLYHNADEALDALDYVRRYPNEARAIARRGQRLAEENHEFGMLAERYARLLEAELA